MIAEKEPSGKICIINVQETPLDQFAQLRIHYFCDEALELLAKHLNI
jgi:NAD-dependent SIR2 family protein deacetylase